MNQVFQILKFSLFLVCLIGVHLPTSTSGADRVPNFVVIMADDLGAHELACYGHKTHRTPHLDKLAKSGVRFRTCFSTPICSPTRVMIMTGRYGFRTGWYNFTGRPGSATYQNPKYDLGTAETTFADILKQQNYVTALAGKWQLTGKVPTMVHDCGFDEYRIWAYKKNLPAGVKHTGAWEGKGKRKTSRFWNPSLLQNGKYLPTKPNDYGPDLFADFAIDFMKRNQHRPFCVYMPMVLTHTPWTATPVIPDSKKENNNQKRLRTKGGLQNNVETADRIVGRIVAALDKLDLRKNTIVIFAGDNGTQGAGKAEPSERGCRVPLIVSCPGTVATNIVSEEVTDLTDILPTLAEFAGVDIPKSLSIDGHSMVTHLKNPKKPHKEWCFSYLHKHQILRDKRWLYESYSGKFYDTSNRRHGNIHKYKDVTHSNNTEAVAARKRFKTILEKLPAPENLKPDPSLERKKAKWGKVK